LILKYKCATLSEVIVSDRGFTDLYPKGIEGCSQEERSIFIS
jgi:hypothetical protein